MNVKKIRSRKALKFLGLLISAMVIAAVSAEVYRYMYIDGSIIVGSQQMSWILGDDAPGGSSISGTTVIMAFPVEQGTPTNFTEALFLKNNNLTGASFTYNITVANSVNSTDFQRAQMHIYENYTMPWTYLDTIDLTNATDFYSNTLNGTQYLRMTFEINATMTPGIRNFDIQVEYW